jgi:hypothetical protein
MSLPVSEKGEKGDAEASPYRSVEATESALGLLPSMALSSAQFGLIIAAWRRFFAIGSGVWQFYLGGKIRLSRIPFPQEAPQGTVALTQNSAISIQVVV